jgi:hypothetical protein
MERVSIDKKVPGMRERRFVTARTLMLLAVFCCSLLAVQATWAFFPIGAYDTGGTLRLKQYNRSVFDNNNDGEVSEDEGIPVYIENGKSGFTEAELEVVEEALRVWERIPQSFASTNVQGMIQDPIFTGQGTFDTLNVIGIQVNSTQDLDGDGLPDEDVEPDDIIVNEVSGGVAGINIFFWAAEDTIIVSGTETVLISSGTIIDNDILINADLTRPASAGEEPLADLLSTLVHEMGHFYGLAHTPLNNLDGDATTGSLVESAVLTHSISGVSRQIGVTPTMYPILFDVIGGNGARIGGGADLAPDDISAMAWLYPRGSQDLYFGLNGEVRTRTNAGTGLPSAAIPGAHIVAWADVDNDTTTPRVAVFSTLSARYNNSPIFPEREGRFELDHIWKTMETESGLFNATYTFSSNPLNFSGYDRQAPPEVLQNPTTLDSIAPKTLVFNNVFTSEVLHETENIVDISNKDAGTPFVWDFQRQTLVSTNTERSIESVVGTNPMFGDPNDVCILNVVGTGTGDGGGAVAGAISGAKSVRSLRDGILLETALGSLVVDTYYRISPTAAQYILGSSFAYGLTARAVGALYWCLDNMLYLLGGALLFAWLLRRGQRRLTRAASAATVALFLLIGSSAQALLLYQSTEQLAANATDIVSGKVTSVVARQDTPGGRIYTDIVIDVGDTAKGTLNKQSNITFTQLGGRVGGLVMEVSEMPEFTVGETVVLYLEFVEGFGYRVYNGLGGKTPVLTSATNKQQTVALPADIRAKKAKALPTGVTVPARVTLAEYMAELRAIVKAQKRAAQN